MEILVTAGSGTGKTALAAFDKALFEAGIANYNLIKLSSVIPPNTTIITDKGHDKKENEYGHRLYVVIAEAYSEKPGEEAWSGLGWVHHSDNSGKGLFVEHIGQSKEEVEDQITKSLNSMAVYRPEERGKINMKVCGVNCIDDPVCSIVVASYKGEGWE
jgi:arginine decarboxylase